MNCMYNAYVFMLCTRVCMNGMQLNYILATAFDEVPYAKFG